MLAESLLADGDQGATRGYSESRIDADETSEPHWRLVRMPEEDVCKPRTQLETK